MEKVDVTCICDLFNYGPDYYLQSSIRRNGTVGEIGVTGGEFCFLREFGSRLASFFAAAKMIYALNKGEEEGL